MKGDPIEKFINVVDRSFVYTELNDMGKRKILHYIITILHDPLYSKCGEDK